jgi:hypothetical protein
MPWGPACMHPELAEFDSTKLAARRDPETSHEAAEGARWLRNAHTQAILAVLRAAACPLTACGIAARTAPHNAGTELTSVQFSRRLKALVDAFMVVVDGEGLSDSGRLAQAYRIHGSLA